VLPDGTNQYRTFLGSMLSITTLLAVVLFAAYKLVTLITFEDFKI